MRFTSKDIVIEYLELMVEKSQLVIERNISIINVHDFLSSFSSSSLSVQTAPYHLVGF